MLERAVYTDLIATTQRIMRLSPHEMRVTEYALVEKNPNYSVCDIVLRPETLYSIEYLLSSWESLTCQLPCFAFKNTGSVISLCCYVHMPDKFTSMRHVREYNLLRMNDVLIVDSHDIDMIKPTQNGILTKFVVRRSTFGSGAFSLELVAFGPENETEYFNLLRELHTKTFLPSTFCGRSHCSDGRVVDDGIPAIEGASRSGFCYVGNHDERDAVVRVGHVDAGYRETCHRRFGLIAGHESRGVRYDACGGIDKDAGAEPFSFANVCGDEYSDDEERYDRAFGGDERNGAGRLSPRGKDAGQRERRRRCGAVGTPFVFGVLERHAKVLIVGAIVVLCALVYAVKWFRDGVSLAADSV
ncbi:GP50 [Caviid betaherpesvirus 2]|uniref:GP50 n=1 Tax=Guinea pig cytomegalovirus (strain 22122) TaxID=103920 RepID=E9RH66_GPCMV|nr:GP50 [Caviid betaherpesvirus 2]AGE11529.1 GP50 [Caviid betaherpesvirus 2]AIL83917.1 GP50 [BAC cloning vector GPN13BACdenovo_preserved(MM)]BAJ78518.1 GP50 [Caviid betaherpesvirus 2]